MSIYTVQWAVTGRCNFRCRHCFVGEVHEELPLSDLIRLCDRLKEAGVPRVSLTGGEPLTRKDLPALAEALAARGIAITQIATNGSLLTEDFLRELIRIGHRPRISISYDGDEGWHDRLRGRTGAAESALRAFDLCVKAGLSTASEMTLHSGNLPVLRRSLATLAAHGCGEVKALPLMAVGRGRTELSCPAPPEPEPLFESFMDAVAGYYAGEYPLRLSLYGFFSAGPDQEGWSVPMARIPEDGDGRSLCEHAAFIPYLTADGRLLPCTGLAGFPGLAEEFPSLLETSLAEAMASRPYRAFLDYTRTKHQSANRTCADCKAWKTCSGGCRLNALCRGDGFSGCDPWCCAFFLGGWREKIPGAIRRGKLEKMLQG